MKLLPAAVALALVGFCIPATANPPMPDMVAQASLQTGGVAVAWTSSSTPADNYVVERSHAGSPFTTVATVSGAAFSLLDPAGQVSDVYLVKAISGGGIVSTSNPAPALLTLACPWVTNETPPEVNCSCFPCP